MPTPGSSITERTPLKDTTSESVQTSFPAPLASQNSGSYFAEAGPSGTNIPPYRPRPSPSFSSFHGTTSRQHGTQSTRFQPGSYAGSSSTVRSRPGARTLDNWQALQDLVGDLNDEEDSDAETERGVPRSASMTGLWKQTSTRSLRSFFSLPPPESERRTNGMPIPAMENGNGQPIASTLLSSSPRQIGLSSVYDEPIQEDAEGENGNGNGQHVPLLQVDPLKDSRPAALSKAATTGGQYWPPSPVAIAIFKCALTYLIASLFTFVPVLARSLSTSSEVDAHGRVTKRPAYSAHMVATIVVYFNPAKTVGNMFLATRFCAILALLATGVSLMSMLTLHVFDHFSPSQGSDWDWISEIGDWMVCGLWIGGSMGFLAWAKVWVNNPMFNSGCSMAAVTIYTVVIKEGALPKLLEVLLIVLIGAVITNLVCFLVFPMSATTRLQASISRSLTSFSTLLDLLTSTFLLKKNVTKDTHITLKAAVAAHAAAFRTLQNDLAEAKSERVFDSRIRGKKVDLYDAAIGSLTRLAQHLAGLRGSTRLQEGLIRAIKEGKFNLDLHDGDWDQKRDMSASILQDLYAMPGPNLTGDEDVYSSVRLFLQFRDIAGKDMDNLVSFCDDALEAVQAIAKKRSHHDVDLTETRTGLATSLKQFNKSSSMAIKRLYAGPKRKKGVYGDSDSSDDDEHGDGQPDSPDTIGGGLDGPNEAVFLIYFFLFTLEEFAREMLFLLDTVTEILNADSISTIDYVKSLWPSKRNKDQRRADYLYKQFRQVVPVDPSQLQPPLFPKNARDGRNVHIAPAPSALSPLEKLRQQFWEFGDWLRTPNMRYAIKTGLGGAILAAPAYTESLRPIFLEYRGEWALIAYFSAISPTVGQTNFLSFFRVIGTIVGATVAVLFYVAFPENPIVLPILGVIFSLPCYYVITQMPDYGQAARFTLLTYNLTCLYAYNLRERDISPFSIAFHRSTSVIIGVVWAAFVSRYWWPFTARRELRMGLSDFCLDLSYLYSKLVTTYSKGVDPPSPVVGLGEDVHEPLLPVGSARHSHLNQGVKQFMAMELHLQSQLGSLRSLLSQTKNEPRLKGPFAFEFYKEVLLSCERMLDRLHSMRCVTTRDEWDNGIRKAFVAPVNKQRREMAGNVILYFYTLSAGFRLRTPMPPYLPPAEHARQRLVEAIRDLDVVKRRSEVIAELEYLGMMMQEAFGVISQSTVIDFEALFEMSPNMMGLVAPGQTL